MDNLFDFRDKEFKKYIMNNLPLHFILFPDHKKKSFLKILAKDNITDGDLLRVYFIFNDSTSIVDKLLFNYKMRKISEERVFRFLDIVKKKFGVVITRRMTYNDLLFEPTVTTLCILDELVDVFLDEV